MRLKKGSRYTSSLRRKSQIEEVSLSCCHAITISSNGNSPSGKMPAVSVKDIEFGGFVPINPFKSTREEKKLQTEKVEAVKSIPQKKNDITFLDEKNVNYLNNTKLPVNERYRRLIPYMTFYLANDFNRPHNEEYTVKPQLQNVVVPSDETANGKHNLQYTNIPKYQGNRLTNYNIASAFPTKTINDYFPSKFNNYSPQNLDAYSNNAQGIARPQMKHIYQNVYNSYQNPIPVPVKVNYIKTTDSPRLEYYSKPKYPEKTQQYKLVPYEQTPPVQLLGLEEENEFVPKVNPYYKRPNAVPATLTKNNNNYREQYISNYQVPVTESYTTENSLRNGKEVFYYAPVEENQYNEPNNIEYVPEQSNRYKKPYHINPVTESGFKPMINTASPTPASKFVYITSPHHNYVKQSLNEQNYKFSTVKPKIRFNIHTTEQPLETYSGSSEEYADLTPNYGPSGEQHDENNLAQILKTLQDTHSLPQKITADNVDSSIKTLVQIINNLKSTHGHNEDSTRRPLVEITSTYKPPVAIKQKPRYKQKFNIRPTLKPVESHDYAEDLENEHPGIQDIDNNENDYLDDERGGTPGKPGVDYPTLATIPTTQFDCKEQRYKGFFGDPETNCQVWHYCDLNGGKASFLCPNGTIFSQVALTCDWWFNVKCDTTAQLYVLNERLYKYILPYTPKFPEDYSGPLVDKYLSIKYKEMEEEELKKKEKEESEDKEKPDEDQALDDELEGGVDTHKVDVIEIKPSGMSGALRPYENK